MAAPSLGQLVHDFHLCQLDVALKRSIRHVHHVPVGLLIVPSYLEHGCSLSEGLGLSYD